jgi:hypothetical protein
MELTGKNRSIGEKPVPGPLCPPQIPHGLAWDRTRASAVRGRRLTAWAMARTKSKVTPVRFEAGHCTRYATSPKTVSAECLTAQTSNRQSETLPLVRRYVEFKAYILFWCWTFFIWMVSYFEPLGRILWLKRTRGEAKDGELLRGTGNKVAVEGKTLYEGLWNTTVLLQALFQHRTVRFMERYRINLTSINAIETSVLPCCFATGSQGHFVSAKPCNMWLHIMVLHSEDGGSLCPRNVSNHLTDRNESSPRWTPQTPCSSDHTGQWM